MKFLLIAYCLVAGAWQSDIADYDLSIEDCAYAVEQQATPERPLGCEPDLEALTDGK